MDNAGARPPTFCRFGFDESLSLDEMRALINQKKVGPEDLILTGEVTQWRSARDVALLEPYFGETAARRSERKQLRNFKAKFSEEPHEAESESSPLWTMLGALFVFIIILFSLIDKMSRGQGVDGDTLLQIGIGIACLTILIVGLVNPEALDRFR